MVDEERGPLSEYRRKRDFRRTSEPRPRFGRRGGRDRFVVQQHDATSMHYDFRLEYDGVLKSWAVPKGPSTDPRQRRLAQRTEDHPVDYLGFEGAIPSGQYGAGPVIVWDTGTYRNISERHGDAVPLGEALEHGHASVWLEGDKLRGGWSLIRMRGGDRESWLLVKRDDEHADRRRNPERTQPESVVSGRTIAEVGDDDES